MNIVQQVAQRVFAGETIDLDDLAATVAAEHPDLREERTASAWKAWCRGQLRRAERGELPFALSVDNHGTYRQRSFMDVDEYRFGIRQYMRRSGENRTLAYRLADDCQSVHGVWIDPATEVA